MPAISMLKGRLIVEGQLLVAFTLCSSHRCNGARPGADVHDIRRLQPWHPEVSALPNSLVQHSTDPVIHDCALSTIHCTGEVVLVFGLECSLKTYSPSKEYL